MATIELTGTGWGSYNGPAKGMIVEAQWLPEQGYWVFEYPEDAEKPLEWAAWPSTAGGSTVWTAKEVGQ